LRYKIPKDILHNFYRDHREDYNCKDTYMKVNLYNYYRMNYDPEVYKQEQEESRKQSLEKAKETA
jgi:hypothetical protein